MQNIWFRVKLRKEVPYRLWGCVLKWVTNIMQRTAGSASSLHYRTSLEEVTGETPDISEYLDFSFYDCCWYNGNVGLGQTKLGKCLGVSHGVSRLMSYWVLTSNGTVVSRTTLCRFTNIQSQTDENKARITALYKAIKELLNDEYHVIVQGGKGKPKDWSEYPFDSDPYFQEEFSHVVSNKELSDADNNFSLDVYDDTYLSIELSIPKRG